VKGKQECLPERSKQGDPVVPLHEKTGIRILNLILILLHTLETFDDIALSHLSSHPVENFFGYLRRSVHDVNTFTQMLTATAKSGVVREGYKRLRTGDQIRRSVSNAE
jgi:hypothetical protein